jgi:hypothetical protein
VVRSIRVGNGPRGLAIGFGALVGNLATIVPRPSADGRSYLVRLLRTLGYRSTVRVVGGLRALWAPAREPCAQVVLGGWTADSVAASAFDAPLFGCATSRHTFNRSGFCDARLEAQLRRALAAPPSGGDRGARRGDSRLRPFGTALRKRSDATRVRAPGASEILCRRWTCGAAAAARRERRAGVP